MLYTDLSADLVETYHDGDPDFWANASLFEDEFDLDDEFASLFEDDLDDFLYSDDDDDDLGEDGEYHFFSGKVY